MKLVAKVSEEEKEVEHMYLSALLATTRMQFIRYLNTGPVGPFKLQLKNHLEHIEAIERIMNGNTIAHNIPKEYTQCLEDSASAAAISIDKIARCMSVVPESSIDSMYAVAGDIEQTFINTVPIKYRLVLEKEYKEMENKPTSISDIDPGDKLYYRTYINHKQRKTIVKTRNFLVLSIEKDKDFVVCETKDGDKVNIHNYKKMFIKKKKQ